MAIAIWKKQTVLREYGEPTNIGGYRTESYTDYLVKLDVQTTSDTTMPRGDGASSTHRIKTFGDHHIRTAQEVNKADRIFFMGKWFECTASRMSNNTWIRHWTSELCECLDQDAPPTITGGQG